MRGIEQVPWLYDAMLAVGEWTGLKRWREWLGGGVEALPFRDGAFDTVVSGLVFCSVPRPPLGLAEVKRVLRADGELRMLEHVRATTRLGARWQDATQPLWTWIAGGCHRNRDTERTVEEAGFAIAPQGRRARDT